MQRICVVGNSGSGKTHLAGRLSRRLGVPHVELDALIHRAGWQEAPAEELRAELSAALAAHERDSGGWVVDGNYRSRVAGLVHPDVYVWLDYPRALVMARVVRRTLGRLLMRRELWNGNRERWRNLLLRDPGENIVLWSWTQHEAYRTAYREAIAEDPGRWVQLRSPRETDRWLAGLTP